MMLAERINAMEQAVSNNFPENKFEFNLVTAKYIAQPDNQTKLFRALSENRSINEILIYAGLFYLANPHEFDFSCLSHLALTKFTIGEYEDREAQNIVANFANLTTLTALKFTHVNIEFPTMITLINNNPSLTELEVVRMDVDKTNELLISIQEFKIASLTLIAVTHNDTSISAINRMLDGGDLEKLSLLDSKLDDKELSLFLPHLQHNTDLIELKLDNNKFTELGLGHLFEALRYNTTLTGLSMENCLLGEEGGRKLVKFLNVNTSIEVLSLVEDDGDRRDIRGDRDDSFSAETVSSLVTALKVHPSLQVLSLPTDAIKRNLSSKLVNIFDVNSTLISLSPWKLNLYPFCERNRHNHKMRIQTLVAMLLKEV